MTDHRIIRSAWTEARPRYEWFECACGATWTARVDQPGDCPGQRKEPPK